MANAAVTDDDEAFMAAATPAERDAVARAEFFRLCWVRKSHLGIGRKSEIDKELDDSLDAYLMMLTDQERTELHKQSGVKSG